MAIIWTFYDYVSDIGTNHVARWVNKELTTQEESDFDTLLNTLSKMQRWVWPDYRSIVNSPDLGEIRWSGQSRRTLRIVGLPLQNEKVFVCLLGCTHKDGIYKPPDWLNTSVKRFKALQRNEGILSEHQV